MSIPELTSQAGRIYPTACACQDTCLQHHWPQQSGTRGARRKPDWFCPAALGCNGGSSPAEAVVETSFAVLIFINVLAVQAGRGVQVLTASRYPDMFALCRERNTGGVKRMPWLWLEKEGEECFPETQPYKVPFWLQGEAGLRHLHPRAAQPP